MSKKQIIIDGVDVSGCENLMQGIVPFGCMEDRKTCSCMNNPNCLYKQLKRKEEECGELKRAKDDFFKHAEISHEAVLNKNKIIDEQEKQLDQLKAENDELKKTIMYKCPQCGDEYLSPIGASLYEKNNKLKQTLAEIKDIAKNMNNECFYDDFECKDCDMKNGCTYFNKKQILQKISEYEVEND